MGEHIDNRKFNKTKSKKKNFNEGGDPLSRSRRVTFKNYLREQEEELLEDDLNSEEDNPQQSE